MSLPNPHGSASGQIAHNSVYDTGVTPGSTGGKFIGFGEEGTSYVTNRSNWALSENIDYVYQIMAMDRAIPAGASFTSSGQNTYQIVDDVWVGDAGYPVSEAEGLLMLFAVMDAQYNELTDVSGHEVRVAIVRDSTNVTNAYKNGFENNPVITFKTVDSSGADVQNPYTILNAQSVRILYGSKSNFEGLPIDALVKFKLQSATEVEAGAFLQDGTKKMTGNADFDGHSLLNPDQVLGQSGAGMEIHSQQDLILRGDTGCHLKDQFLSAALSLSEVGEADVNGVHNSIVGAINGQLDVSVAYFGNRCLNRDGSLAFTDGTGQVAWPTLQVAIDGERRVVAAGSYIATNNGSVIFVAAVDATGTVVERASYALLPTDIPLAAYTWDGGAFTRKVDIRWAYNGTSRHLEVTCGESMCDFAHTELDKAIELVCRLSAAAIDGQAHMPRVRVIGAVVAPSAAPYNIKLSGPVEIVGAGPALSIISSDDTNGDSVDLFDCAGFRVVVKDISIRHSGAAQASTLGAFKNAGDGSIFQNIKFDKDSGGLNIGFANAFHWTLERANILIEQIEVVELTWGFILGSDSTYATAYLTESRIRDCRLNGWGASASHGIVANGDGNIIENVTFTAGVNDYAIVAGNDTLIDRCKIIMSGAGGVTPAAVLYKPLSSGVYHKSTIIRDSFFMHCGDGVQCTSLTGIRGHLIVRGNYFNAVDRPINFSSVGTPGPGSNVLVEGNDIHNTLEYVALLTADMRYVVANNVCTAVGGAGIVVGIAVNAKVFGNVIEGYGNAGAYDNAIAVVYLAGSVHVTNNQIGDVGAPAGSTMIELNMPATIANNHIIGSGQADYGIRTIPSGIAGLATSIENKILGNTIAGQLVAGVRIAGGSNYYYNGSRIAHNRLPSFGVGAIGVEVDNAEGVVIDGNTFGGDSGALVPYLGRAIYIHGTGSAGSVNCQIINNHLKNVKGASGSLGSPRIIEVTGDGNGCSNIMIANNHLQECGTSDPAHFVVGTNQRLIHVYAAPNYQIRGNHISQLTGMSSGVSNSDECIAIYVYGGPGQIDGNYIYHNFAVAGYVADTMVGIEVATATLVSVTNNRLHFTGTQGDANKSDVVYGINCGANAKLLVVGNTVTGSWNVPLVTTSRAIVVDGNACTVTGNAADGGTDHSIWVSGAGGVCIGNIQMGGGEVTWNMGTNLPSAATYQDSNVGATSHG